MSLVAELDIAEGAVGLAWTEGTAVAVGLVSEEDIASLPLKELSLADAFRDAKENRKDDEHLWVQSARDELEARRDSSSATDWVVAQLNFANRLCALGALDRHLRYLDEAVYYFAGAEQDAQEWLPSAKKDDRNAEELLGKSKQGLAFALCHKFGLSGTAADLDRAVGLLEGATEIFTRIGDAARAEGSSFECARVRFHAAIVRRDDAATMRSGLTYRSAIQNHRFETTDPAVAHRVWLAQFLVQAADRRRDAHALRIAAEVAGETAHILEEAGEGSRAGSALGLQGIALVAATRIDGAGFQEANAVLERSSQMLAFGPSIVAAHVHFTRGLLQLHPGSGSGERIEELGRSAELSQKAYTAFQECSSKDLAAKARLNQALALLVRAQETRDLSRYERYDEAYRVCASAALEAGDNEHLRALALCHQGAAASALAERSQASGAWSEAVSLLAAAEDQLSKHAQVHLIARVCHAQALLGQAKQSNDDEGILRAAERLKSIAEETARFALRTTTSASEVDSNSRSVAGSDGGVASTGEGTEEIRREADASRAPTALSSQFEEKAAALAVAQDEAIEALAAQPEPSVGEVARVLLPAPNLTPAALEKLADAIRAAQQDPPEDRHGFVAEVNRILDSCNLRIRLADGSLARLTVTPSSSLGSIQFTGPGIGTRGFRKGRIEVVPAPEGYIQKGRRPWKNAPEATEPAP